VEAEHRVQLGLLRALRQALERGDADRSISGALARQLLEYSEVHFLSEQLLMRLYAYPGYDDHLLEHDRLIDRLQATLREWQKGELSEAGQLLDGLEDWLLSHMTTSDDRLEQYLVASGRVPA
jgi:hemerythrin